MMTRTFAVGVVALFALASAACNGDNLTKINENPNAPTEAPPGPLFTNAVAFGVGRWDGQVAPPRIELLAQQLAEVQYPESDQYKRLRANFTAAPFNAAYNNELRDLESVSRVGEAMKEPGYWGPARLMQAWEFGMITDQWGDVPYSQALRGDSAFDNALSPKYDPQQQIYAGLLATIDAAVKGMAAAPTTALTLGSADPIYSGSLAKWQRFGNSLRARLAMHMVNVDPAKANTELAAAFAGAGGLIAANTDNAILTYPGDGIFDNPWSVNFQGRDDFRVSDRLMAFLQGYADPRLSVYAMPTDADPTKYAGLPNALEHSDALPNMTTTSRPGIVLYPVKTAYGTFNGNGATFPSFIITFAEVSFIRAEAAERGLGGLTAAQAAGFYNAGIRASMEQWGVTDNAKITAYLARPEVAYKGGVAGLKQIGVQKWIALYTQGIEAWTEWRRTCEPETIKPGPAAVFATHPRRLEYSTTETAVNAANVGEAVTRQGADLMTTRIWWDSKPTAAPTYFSGCGTR